MNQTRKDAEAKRTLLGLTNGGSTYGLGSNDPDCEVAEVTLEEILKTSQAVELRQGADVVNSLAMKEEDLAEIPLANQPPQLKTQLLPYQLQVSLNIKYWAA